MLIGHARVSTADQDLALQTNALVKAGGGLVTDKASGAEVDRPGLVEALDLVRAGDTLVIWKLARLGRSIQGLIELAANLSARKVDFQSLTGGFDTATPTGRLPRSVTTLHLSPAVAFRWPEQFHPLSRWLLVTGGQR
jgi:DNA invertase Pin-like site-specific DNA recombinase